MRRQAKLANDLVVLDLAAPWPLGASARVAAAMLMATQPRSFRLPDETVSQLDRLASLLTRRYRRDHSDDPAALKQRDVTLSDAVAVAIADTLQRLEREMEPDRERYREAADAGRGLLGGLSGSLSTELAAERRAEAAMEAT